MEPHKHPPDAPPGEVDECDIDANPRPNSGQLHRVDYLRVWQETLFDSGEAIVLSPSCCATACRWRQQAVHLAVEVRWPLQIGSSLHMR
jgi:hypothetical protein